MRSPELAIDYVRRAAARLLAIDSLFRSDGAEDLTPSGFYTKDDAITARDIARKTVAAVEPHVTGG